MSSWGNAWLCSLSALSRVLASLQLKLGRFGDTLVCLSSVVTGA
jgi:hypothetical protein